MSTDDVDWEFAIDIKVMERNKREKIVRKEEMEDI